MSVTDIVNDLYNRPDVTQAGRLVESRFDLSTDLVTQYNDAANDAVGLIGAADFTVPMDNLDLQFEDLTPPPIGEAPSPDRVGAYESQMSPVDFPDLTALRGILDLVEVTVDPVTLPVLEATPPPVNIPPAPDDTLPNIPDEVPVGTDPTLPPVPIIDLPPIPILEEATLPSIPVLENFTFEGTLPTADLTPPEPMFVYDETTYQSDLADALKTKLYNDVTLGGTGLGADIEQDIWDRQLTRLNIELDRAYDHVLTTWETWNLELPDGVLSGNLREVVFDDTRTRLDLTRDIAIEQARLAQQNTQFAITSGMQYEKQIMDFTNQVNQRAFEVARYRVQASIDAFNVKVVSYNAKLDGYKSLAQVFESRIRAELSKVEIYRAQIEGAKLFGDLQEQKVRLYSERVGALNTIIGLYNAQMEGAKLQIEVDRSKVEVFRARLDAVIAQIQGVTAKFNLYQSQIAGETAKVDLYGRQVTAFATQVDAKKIEADINLAEAQATIEANKDKISLLTAAINKYNADTQYELGKEDAGVKVYNAQVTEYDAEVKRETEYIKSKVDSYRAQVNEVMARAELIVKEMDANLRAATAMKEIQMEALKAIAQIQAQRSASALSGASVSAQVGFNGSLAEAYQRSASVNESLSIQNSTSTSDITSNNTNTNISG